MTLARLFAWAAAAVAMTGVAATAAAEVIESRDNGFVTRHSVDVSVPPDKAWEMLRAPARWWSGAHSFSGDAANLYMDAQAGGCFCETLPVEGAGGSGAGQRGSVEHMRIVHADPGKVMRLVGALGPLQSEALNGTLTITFKPQAGGTRVLFEYVVGGFMRFDTATIAPAVDKVLAEQSGRFRIAAGPAVGAPGARDLDPGSPPAQEGSTGDAGGPLTVGDEAP